MTDIVGSTEHAAELGDRGWRELVQLHHAVVRAALRRYGGREIDTAGDGFFAVFDAPAAAVDCALEIAQRVGELGIRIRAGIHVGEVEQIGGKVGGITVPIAARIMAGAGPGEVLASATVRDLAAGAGFRFEDLGTRELKGVPGEWRIFAASRTDAAQAAGPVDDAAQRRAAAVRRARSRPVWQRRPRLVGVLAAAALAAVIAVGLVAWRPWQTPALAGVGENAVGVIDVDRREIVASIKVGGRPSAIAVGGETAWVAVTGEDTVARVDLASRAVTRVTDVGHGPVALALAGGSVWVANGAERSVTRINEDTARVVDTIDVGNRPVSVAAAAGGIWVANAGDGTIVRLDPATGEPGEAIPVAAGPVAVVADDTAVWVASADAAAVTRLDAASGVALAAPIPLPTRPTALAFGGGAVWVATQDGTVIGVEAATGRVTETLDLGGVLVGLTFHDGALWVADRSGAVHRVDPAAPGASAARVPTAAAPESLVAAGGELLVATHAAPTSHRGGTLRVLLPDFDALDPLASSPYNAALLQADGLVGYRRVGGGAGAELLPVLATAIPQPGDGGRAWPFRLRPGLVYSDGKPVLASDVRRAFERSFQVRESDDLPPGAFLWPAIEGADVCISDDETPIERCDLSAGIETDDAARTVTFRMTEPDGDFLAKLALPAAFPVPEGVPMNEFIGGALPGTGPYMLASASESEVRFARNPHFRVFDARVRPDGYADEIVLVVGPSDLSPERRVAMLVEGDADYMPLRGPDRLPLELEAQVTRQHPGLLQPGRSIMTLVLLDLDEPPFDNPDVRRALSLAVDRARIVEVQGGSPAVSTACQILPPGWPGHAPYCPWTASPDPGGRWHGPDLARARELVEASGTVGMPVEVGPTVKRHANVQDELVRSLDALGYEVTARPTVDDGTFAEALFGGQIKVGITDFLQTTLTPGTFFDEFRCGEGALGACDEELLALIEEATALQLTDPAGAAETWAAADRRVIDEAYWVPLYMSGMDMVSERVGNAQFHPQYFVLLDQLWVQ